MSIDPNKERIEKIEEDVARLATAIARSECLLARTSMLTVRLTLRGLLGATDGSVPAGRETVIAEVDALHESYQGRARTSTEPLTIAEEFQAKAMEKVQGYLDVALVQALIRSLTGA